jgi:hypothetical protein
MKQEHQRVAIAEACGWTEIEPCTCCNGVSRAYEPTPGAHKKHLPNYLNDLNAMHEAEELFYAKSDTLEGAERMRDYSKWLCLIAKYPLHATASQRAEAFLRTIGKWEEAK